MRKEFKLTEDQLKTLLEASKPVPYLLVTGGMPPRSPQEKSNYAWAELGKEMGFKPMSVKTSPGKGDEYFTAEVVE